MHAQKQFEDTEPFRKFKEIINAGAARMRQTSIGYLVPPKLRSKGRFQGRASSNLMGCQNSGNFQSEKECVR